MTQLELQDEPVLSKRDASAHTKAQSELITLGKITGWSVWIASNDQGRTYAGKSLAADCLKKLPGMGLSNEAMRRIALIDVIWVSQNAPVCAFEVETSTSIYSGLLRMSDLLAVVPALNIQIYIVAPRERQKKVLAELARPRKTNHTTPEVINSRSVEAYPVLSLVALRKLAEWYAAYQSTHQGVQPCADLDVGQFPPASSGTQSPVNTYPDLGNPPRRAPSRDTADPQSHRSPAAPHPSQSTGGGA